MDTMPLRRANRDHAARVAIMPVPAVYKGRVVGQFPPGSVVYAANSGAPIRYALAAGVWYAATGAGVFPYPQAATFVKRGGYTVVNE